ncbi:MAG: hypothetical protein EPN70_00715 [Paraburkholderia sp.]|uniref:DUF5681 domain-containing protein n=1 Tax=Paraburkholderia sp. TaxID=1926495 RepID=UPI001214B83B|nr:DUF5681 domain-containing protein [Paraburkholderia sp.]TAM08296.1 MAG: hypothetical protein EPN70_00715 [Paraburkholderia sp.]TAM28050.1 MAG: hypothetical protein EPN59_17930 [Paraburkholderia sp.]
MATNSKKPRGAGKQFQPGTSGNPTGRPKKTPEEQELIDMCRMKSRAALDVVEQIMLRGASERTRLAAALAVIERAYGKPRQEIDANVSGQIQTITRRIIDLHSGEDLA